VNQGKRLSGILFFIFLSVNIALIGCDKIPFLSKYFPSKMEENKPATETSTAPASPAPAAKGPVLARVNQWVLTPEEFKEKLAGLKEAMPEYNVDDLESKKLVLEELVRQELLIQDAEKKGMANQKEIVEAVNEFRRTLLVREVALKLTENISVDDTEAQNYYNENKNLFAENTEWQIREMVVPSQTEANEILIELLKGADFATMATERSKSASAAKGGDLGWLSQFPFPQMESAAATLEKGSLSSVFKGPEGYYIVKLEDKKGGTPRDFAGVKEEIKQGLTLLKQQQEVLKYIEKLKSEAKVEIDETLLK